jgi:hypothetical protein
MGMVRRVLEMGVAEYRRWGEGLTRKSAGVGDVAQGRRFPIISDIKVPTRECHWSLHRDPGGEVSPGTCGTFGSGGGSALEASTPRWPSSR